MSNWYENFEQMPGTRILVLGDVILDRYTWGDAGRVSPEAPVLVLRAEEQEVRLGGAASVACLLRHLGANVTLAGVVGDDTAGRTVKRLLEEIGIDTNLVVLDTDRCTTTKERFVGRAAGRHPHQILRVDHESTLPIGGPVEQRLLAGVLPRIDRQQAVLVSDYDKGACTAGVLSDVIARANQAGVPTVVDPARVPNYDRYSGATVLTPNRVEAAGATGICICCPTDAVDAGVELRKRLKLESALVTLDRDGIAVVGDAVQTIPTRPRQVYDITGAGDMVLAMTGLCRAVDMPLGDTVVLANAAAGLEVERFGVAPIDRDEVLAELQSVNRRAQESGSDAARGTECPDGGDSGLHRAATINGPKSHVGRTESPLRQSEKCVTIERMAMLAEAHRGQGRSVVLTNGCFDLLHVGHVTYLQQAASFGDVLVVAINSDASVRALKGPDRPVIDESARTAMLAALECVDHVLTFHESTPRGLIRRIRPDVLVKGGNYRAEEVVGRELVESYGGQVSVTGQVHGASTTNILATVRGSK